MSRTGSSQRGANIPVGAWKGTEALTTQGFLEANAKVGRGFEATGYFPNVAASGQTNTVFRTGATPTIIKVRAIEFIGPGILAQIFEGPAFTGGTPAPIYNQNRNPEIAVATLSTILGGVTVSNAGVECFAPSHGLGSTGVGNSTFATQRPRGAEYHLAPETDYLLRITNMDTANPQTWESYLLWYEGPLSGDVA